ncbi:hypothetical protein CLOP_g14445 [Closterium sp. NIES-67]|nr:hypothetical protein CLOP_g14445 [Closterium sp. NIES-67]
MARLLGARPLPPLLRVLVAVMVVGAGVAGVRGLYEDQVGTYDWYQQRIGRARFASFLTSSQRKRVLVGTDRNVVAALNLRTGDIAWRRVLGDADTLHALDMGGRYLITVSGTKMAAVRAWAVPDGALAWETALLLPSAAASTGGAVTASFITISAPDAPSTDRVVVLLGAASAAAAAAGSNPAAAASAVHCLSAATGEVLWSAALPTPAHSISLLPHGSILLTALSPDLSFSLTTLDAASGKVTASASSPPSSSSSVSSSSSSSSSAPIPGPAAAYVTATGTAVAVDSVSGNVLTAVLVTSATADATVGATVGATTDATVHVRSTPLASLLPKEHYQSGSSATVVPEKAPGSFVWLSVPGAVFLLSAGGAGQAESAGQMSLVDSFPGVSAVSASVVGGAAGAGGGGEGREGGEYHSGLVGSQGGGDSLKFNIKVHQLLPSSSSSSASLLSDSVTVPSPPGTTGSIAELPEEEEELSVAAVEHDFVGEGRSLASVVAVSVAELPEEEEELSVAAVEHDLYEWAHTHLLRAKASLPISPQLTSKPWCTACAPPHLKRSGLVRDRNGFRRILLLLTAPGGGNRASGGKQQRVRWEAVCAAFWRWPSAVGCCTSVRWFCSGWARLCFHLKLWSCGGTPTACHLTKHLKLWCCRFGSRHRSSKRGEIRRERREAAGDAVEKGEKEAEDRKERGWYQPVHVHVFPGTEEARGFRGHKKEVFFYLVDAVTGAVEGYSIGERVEEEGSSGSGGAVVGGTMVGGWVGAWCMEQCWCGGWCCLLTRRSFQPLLHLRGKSVCLCAPVHGVRGGMERC